jgi:hypothetical protein
MVNPTTLFPALVGLWAFYDVRAELHRARAIGERLLSLVNQVQEPTFQAVAHHALQNTLTHLGEFLTARAHFEALMRFIDSAPPNFAVFPSGLDPRVANDSYAAILLWFLGYPEQALQRGQEQ